MREACQEILKPNAGKLDKSFGRQLVPAELEYVATAFVELQGARHEADYDTSRLITRGEAVELIEIAEQASVKWNAVRKSVPGDVFLAALLAKRGMCR
jgi:hypothetical protein